MITKDDLAEKVKRRLGAPLVKVELDDLQIYDHIDYAREKYIKWAVGNATVEKYGTLMLRGGVTNYEMPSGTTDVLSYNISTLGGVNTLFTIDNYFYQIGLYDSMLMRGQGDSYTVISYHIALQFLDTLKRYVVDTYNFRYHRYSNMLEINPAPPSSGITPIVVNGQNQSNTPGFILLRTYVVDSDNIDLYTNVWFLDYVTALCKISLGRVRSKFANFAAVGSNVGLAMDGDALLQEGIAEKEKLEEELRTEEAYEGLDISIG